MWVCLQSVLADDEKENVVLLVVKYSHVVLQFFLLLFSVSFILLPVGFSFVVLGLRQVPAEGPQVMAEKRSIHLNRVLL